MTKQTTITGMREIGPNLSGKVDGDYLLLAINMRGPRQASGSGKSDMIAKAPASHKIAFGDELVTLNLQAYVKHSGAKPAAPVVTTEREESGAGQSDVEKALAVLKRAGLV